jgi:hypothetical protein
LKLSSFSKEIRSSAIEIMFYFVPKKAFDGRVDRWWTEGDDGSQPTIYILTRDAGDPTWRNTVLPALRDWLKTDQFVSDHGSKWEVALLLQARVIRRGGLT